MACDDVFVVEGGFVRCGRVCRVHRYRLLFKRKENETIKWNWQERKTVKKHKNICPSLYFIECKFTMLL